MTIVNKIWQVSPKAEENFLQNNSEYSKIVLQLLFNRGIKEKGEIEKFLNPDYEKDAFDTGLFKNIEQAVDLIIRYIKEQKKITVYGDYDADGVTASALLVEVLKMFKAQVDIYIPYRVSEGYGLNMEAIKYIAEQGSKLIITVDNGIRNKEQVEYAKSLGLEVIITDHHTPPESGELPDCLVIDSFVEGETYPFKYLAGVGVSFKLAKALIQKTKLADEYKRRIEEQALDLVAIGTVADCVSLLGENRVLVKKGLEILNNTKRIGLVELIKAAKINGNKELDSWNIGFQIGPRINAAGRMDHANTAYELLVTSDEKRAKALAQQLNYRNVDRQVKTNEIFDKVEAQYDKNSPDKIIIGVCAIDEEEEVWNEGVVGLVAGKVCEKYYRPSLVITKTEDGYKGSGRSIPEFNLIKAMEECSDFLDKYGGHPAACGFSFSENNLDNFLKKIKQVAAEKLDGVDLRPKLKIETELALSEVDEDLISEINKFGPFGQNNEQPKFTSSGVAVVDVMNMGADGQHIKLKIKSFADDKGCCESRIFPAIGFGQSEKWQDLKVGDIIDIVYNLELNEFNGRTEPQLRIVDIRLTINS